VTSNCSVSCMCLVPASGRSGRQLQQQRLAATSLESCCPDLTASAFLCRPQNNIDVSHVLVKLFGDLTFEIYNDHAPCMQKVSVHLFEVREAPWVCLHQLHPCNADIQRSKAQLPCLVVLTVCLNLLISLLRSRLP
jgi:hypothetical protein